MADRLAPQRIVRDPDWTVVPNVKLVTAEGDSDCGAAALEAVLAFWNPSLDREEVRRALGPTAPHDGYQAGQLRNLAQAHGLNAFLIEGDIQDLVHEIREGRPVIIGIVGQKWGRPFGHYEVVTGINARADRVLIADPQGSWNLVDTRTLVAAWRPARQLTLVVFP